MLELLSDISFDLEEKLTPPKSTFLSMAMLAALSALISQGNPTGMPFPEFGDSKKLESVLEGDQYGHYQSEGEDGGKEDPPDDSVLWNVVLCCGRAKKREPTILVDHTPNKPRERSRLGTPFVSVVDKSKPSSEVLHLINGANMGFLMGKEPKSISEGMGGVYAIPNQQGNTIAIFKPSEEEIGCRANPKGNDCQLREGISPGQSAMREVAAHLLDHGNFVGVPKTSYVQCSAGVFPNHEGVVEGSLQRFVESQGPASDFGSSLFPVSNVQKIAMFDIRVLNLDRHDGNLLVKGDPLAPIKILTPIDHAFILPTRFGVDDFEWCWMDWEQTKRPIEPEVAAYIMALSFEEDALVLRNAGISVDTESLLVLEVMTMVLQTGVTKGLTLHQIATFVSRSCGQQSELEKIVLRSKWVAAVKCLRKSKGHCFRTEFMAQVTSFVDGAMNEILARASCSLQKRSV